LNYVYKSAYIEAYMQDVACLLIAVTSVEIKLLHEAVHLLLNP